MSLDSTSLGDAERVPTTPTPKYLYHYTNADAFSCILENNNIRLRTPLAFNDPFDSLQEALPSPTLEEVKQFVHRVVNGGIDWHQVPKKKADYLRSIRDGYHNSNEIRREELLNQYHQTVSREWFRTNEQFIEDISPQLRKQRMLCLSERGDNCLMWAHYGKGHEGFVIRFDTELLYHAWNKPVIKKIAYREIRPSFMTAKGMLEYEHAYGKVDRKHFNFEAAWTKSVEWQYENEWRLSLPTSFEPDLSVDYSDLPIPAGAIVEVLAGCRTLVDPSLIDRIVHQWPTAKLYQVKPLSGRFMLAASPIQGV